MQNPFPGVTDKVQSFIFGAGTDVPTYEALKRKREKIDELARLSQQSGMPKDGWEGATRVAQTLSSAFGDRRLAPKEDAERERAIGELTSLMGGGMNGGFTGGGFSGTPSSMNMPQDMAMPPAPMAAPQGDRVSAIRQGMIERGLPEHVADGFILNFQDESGLDPGINEQAPIVPGSRGGFGLAQWTGPRRKALESFASQMGAPVSDPNVQLDFLVQELQGPEVAAGSRIMSTRDASEAAAAIATDFLRPAKEHLDRRVSKYTGGAGYSSMGGQAPVDMGKVTQIAELLSNPYLPEGQRMVAQAYIQNEMGRMGGGSGIDPIQAARLDLDREKFAWERENSGQVKPTADIQEYEYAKQQGYDGTFQDFIIDAERAGAVNVTQNAGGPPVDAGTEELQKLDAKAFGAILETAPLVGRSAAQLQTLEQQLASAPQGMTGAWKQMAGEFGIPIDGLDDVQALQATINAMVPAQRPAGSGPMSDADLELFKQSLPRLINQPGGNAQILDTLKRINAYDQQLVSIAERVAAGEISRADGRELMKGLRNPLADLDVTAGTAPTAGVTEDGYRFKGGDPADPANWEKVQ